MQNPCPCFSRAILSTPDAFWSYIISSILRQDWRSFGSLRILTPARAKFKPKDMPNKTEKPGSGSSSAGQSETTIIG